MRILPVMVLLGGATQTTLAQDNPAFAGVVRDPREQQMVIAAAKRSNVVLEAPCDDPHFSIANKFSIYQPLAFDVSGKLKSGAWKQVVDYVGCGMTRTLNVLMYVSDGSHANAYSLLPGTTDADPRLQQDVFRSPALRLQLERWRDPKCAKIYVADTRFIAREASVAPGAREPPWHESWTLAACGRAASLSMTFTPDSSGTSFAITLEPEARDGGGLHH